MPYSLFPAGLAGLGVAMGATRRPCVLGFAAGFLLSELIFLVIMGGVVSFARADVSPWIVVPVTAAILVALVYIWLLMCAYPKCLAFLWCCCKDKFTYQQTRNVCGAPIVDGRDPNVAATGVSLCPGCGGGRPALPDATQTPPTQPTAPEV